MLHLRVIQLDGDGAGSITLPPCRLASLSSGLIPSHPVLSVTATNRGTDFTEGDRLPDEEEFLNGLVTFAGTPDRLVWLYLRYPGR